MNNAVQAAVACNALGILVCDWSLPGQVNPATVSIPALLAGAGLAWKAETDLMTLRTSLPGVLSQHVFLDTSGTFGRALMDLGRTHSTILKDETDESCDVIANNRVQPVARGPGGTLLWQILALKGSSGVAALSSESLQKVLRQIRQCHKVFITAQLNCKQSSHILKELALLMEILLFATRICRLFLLNRKENSKPSLEDLPEINKTDLANKLLALVSVHQKVYVLRNKQGGLFNATQLLQNFLQHLLPENE